MQNFDIEYWDKQYLPGKKIGWDIGYASPPLMEYCEQLLNKEIDILIPGAGLAWEAEELYKMGFQNTKILEFALLPIQQFLTRVPDFPETHVIQDDFFTLLGQFDLILEQTFFTSLPKERRPGYVRQMVQLLKPGGKLVGLLFTHEFDGNHPPFGGTREEYLELFTPSFKINTFEIAYNSIKPRKGREYFMILEKEG